MNVRQFLTKIYKLKTDSHNEKNAIDVLTKMIEPDLKLVNHIILKETENRVSLIPKLANHIISSGGKPTSSVNIFEII